MRNRLKQKEVAAYRQKLLKKQRGVCPLCGKPINPGEDTLDHCFDDQTEVLSDKGFVLFRDLPHGAEVAQWENGEISFVKPTDYISYNYAGPMIAFHKRDVSIVCTPEHRMITRDLETSGVSVIQAEHLPFGDERAARKSCIPKTGVYHGPGVALTHDEIRLYVAFQADGCWATGARFRLRKLRKIVRLKNILRKLDIPYTEHNTDCHQIYIGINDTPSYLTKTFDIPLVKFSRDQLMVFVEELKYWDGCQLKGSQQYSSTDKRNTDYVRMATTLYGLRGTDWAQKRLAPKNDLYYVNFSSPVEGDSNRNIKKTPVYYNGMVYCVSVPSGAIIIRRQGKVAVCGNCHETGHVRAVLHRNCNQVEGRIRHWAMRVNAEPIEFLEAIAAHWSRQYDHLPLHPNHKTEVEKEILRLKRRRRKLKTQKGKDRITAKIKSLGG